MINQIGNVQTHKRLNIVEALKHPQLFGALPAFKNLESWKAWIVVIKCLQGLPLDSEAELKLFRQCTGRYHYNPPKGGFPEMVIIVGVQSGKSSIAGVLLASATLTGKAGRYAVGVCQDLRGSMRVLLRYARMPFETLDNFKGEVVRSTADLMELRNGVFLCAYPNNSEAMRGLEAEFVVIDELAFFVTSDGRPNDREMLRVARGRVANSGGKVVIISSPYAQNGCLYDLHRKHYGQEDSSTLVWQASAFLMNPTLSTNYLARMEADDPEAYRSEVLGEFRSGTSTLFDSDGLQACVDTGIRERPFQPGVQHTASIDSASGSGQDSFTLTIVHPEGDCVVVDLVRAWRPPFNPSGVIAEISDLLKAYGIRTLSGDKYAPGFVQELFRSHGIDYQFADQSTSDAYLALVSIVNSGQVTLLDHPELLRELRGLERRRGSSGRDRADHRSGSHDDLCASAACAIVGAKKPQMVPGVFVF
ncbi:MAG: hypothetical protein L0H94_05235 [Nitrospira sp.]|nr:hypothetical protein [Nitrospira sp.]